MSKVLAIIGAGDLGRQIAHYAISDKHYDEVVFFDDFLNEKEVYGHKIIGTTLDVEIAFQNMKFDELIIGIGYKHLSVKKKLFERFNDKIPFGNIKHSSCWIDKTARIDDGVVIFPNCCIDAHSVIESNSILNLCCSISHDTIIGKHCFLSPRVAIAGFVIVEEQCIVGINATIIDNIKVVSQIQIGGGTVVIENLKTKGLYVGNPARFIR